MWLLRYKKNSNQCRQSGLDRSDQFFSSKFPLGPMVVQQLVKARASLRLRDSVPWSARRSDTWLSFPWHHILGQHPPKYLPYCNSSWCKYSPEKKIPCLTINSTKLSKFLNPDSAFSGLLGVFTTLIYIRTLQQEACTGGFLNLFVNNWTSGFYGTHFGKPCCSHT